MKGISPIVSTVLLILVTLVISTLFFLWYSSFEKKIRSEIERRAEEEVGRFAYKISVETVFCNTSSKEVKIFIRNVGEKEIPTGQAYVYIYDENMQLLYSSPEDFEELPPDNVRVLNITWNGLAPNSHYYVKVTVPKYPEGDVGDCET